MGHVSSGTFEGENFIFRLQERLFIKILHGGLLLPVSGAYLVGKDS